MSGPASMTAFAAASAGAWTWELRSVNNRGLDIRLRLPPGLDRLETPVRAAARARCGRGSLAISLDRARDGDAGTWVVNEEWLARLRKICGGGDEAALLGLRGVIEPAGEAATPPGDAELLAALEDALEGLVAERLREGAALGAALREHLDRMRALVAGARGRAEAQPERIRARLQASVDALATTLPPERLAQEVALLAAKADIREELDRLDAHLDAAASLVETAGPIGRRLDFLCQEINREANTLLAKSADIELTRTGLEVRAALERFREQVQNVE